jgi:hypothetical protein
MKILPSGLFTIMLIAFLSDVKGNDLITLYVWLFELGVCDKLLLFKDLLLDLGDKSLSFIPVLNTIESFVRFLK